LASAGDHLPVLSQSERRSQNEKNMHGLKRSTLVNPIEAYISAQRRALEEPFPARDDSAALCHTDELASFLTYALLGLLDMIEHEIDALYQTEHSMVQLDALALMFDEVRHAAWRYHTPIHGF
jgi:hypothetical protein